MSASRFTPVRLDPAHPLAAPSPALASSRRGPTNGNGPRMRVLLVLSTRSAVDQGLFDLIPGLVDRVAFSIAGDETDPKGLTRTIGLAKRHAIPVHPEPRVPLRSLLRRDDWDLIETSGGTDPAALELILDEVADRALVHTLADPAESSAILPRLIRRADAVLCSTPLRRREIQRTLAPGRNHCFHLAPDPADASNPARALATAKWRILAATWFTRHYLDRPFQGPRPLAKSAGK